MNQIRTEDAVGHILCHDITQIIKDVKKEVAFKKGHIVREEDIPVLLSVGKRNLYVWEQKEGMLHENEAAEILYEICKNENMTPSEIKEGKIELIAECDGLFKVDAGRLNKINALGDMMIATRHGNRIVRKGDKLAGARVIPLVIEDSRMKQAREIGGSKPLLQLKRFEHKKVGIVTTGSEVFSGLIQDTFTPVLVEKLREFDTEIIGQVIVGDQPGDITDAIKELIKRGADMILCTGGMSVDPDDRTPSAIRNTGADIVVYGAPVLPGAMFLLAYYNNNIPIMGLPGCVMYSKRTIFDLVLPRIMAGEKLAKEDIHGLGYGGLCLSCQTCTYPICGFGDAM